VFGCIEIAICDPKWMVFLHTDGGSFECEWNVLAKARRAQGAAASDLTRAANMPGRSARLRNPQPLAYRWVTAFCFLPIVLRERRLLGWLLMCSMMGSGFPVLPPGCWGL